MEFDPIRVLILDDVGEGALSQSVSTTGGGWARIPTMKNEENGDLFEVRWLANAREAREYKDLTRLLSSQLAYRCREDLWVPEILCFDYDLTEDEDPVDIRLTAVGDKGDLYGQVSPLPILRAAVETLGLAVPAGGGSPPSSVCVSMDDTEFDPRGSWGRGQDVTGCYVGGTLLLTFGDHPCAPVPYTRHTAASLSRTDAAFFEWLLSEEGDLQFDKKPDKLRGWKEVLRGALPSLRRRIITLTRGRRLRVALQDVLHLRSISDLGELASAKLRIGSRFREAALPAQGLWSDMMGEDEVLVDVNRWAKEVLEILTPPFSESPLGGAHLASADQLAEEIWKAYCDEPRVKKRERLSLLVQKGDPFTPEEREELNELREFFGVQSAACHLNTASMWDSRNQPGPIRRWASLFVMVRLVSQYHELVKRRSGVETTRVGRPALSGYDFLIALHPVPGKPLVLFPHIGKDQTNNAWASRLKDLKDGDDPIPLSLEGVISGDTPLRPGEAYLLRQYAYGLGLDSTQNPDGCFWEKDTNVD